MKMHFVSNKSSLPLWRHCLHPFNCITPKLTSQQADCVLNSLPARLICRQADSPYPHLLPSFSWWFTQSMASGGRGWLAKTWKTSKVWNPNLLGYCCISSPSMMKASVPTANMHQAWIIHRVHNHVYSAFQWYHSIIHRHREIYSNSTKWIMLFGHPKQLHAFSGGFLTRR